jgi:ADP-dependent NAD(P)H-hydrate dehydratase / NAD(P)H-hydrate epimerase
VTVDSVLPPDAGPFFGHALVHAPTGTESTRLDREAISSVGVPGAVLMENAGRAAAQVLAALVPRGPVLVLAGPGNNGGDGIVLARTLAAWGRTVEILVCGDREEPDPLLHGWEVPTSPVPRGLDALLPRLDAAAVVVDALLGTGIKGAPREPFAGLIREVNRSAAPVLSLDVPSGVDGDSGAVSGEAVRARWTVGFGAPKLGTLLHPGRERTGRLLAVEIGFPPWSDDASSARVITPGWATRVRPRRALRTHKNAAGRLLLLVGSGEMGGAALLAARAALRAGVGYLRVATPPDLRTLVQGGAPEAVHVDASDEEALLAALGASDAVAAGPGLGTGTPARARLEVLLREGDGIPLLLDADALNLLAAGELGSLGESGTGPVLLTPHPGEAARLLDGRAEEVVNAPVGAARAVSRRFSATVLLKGTPSLVSPPPGSRAPVLVSSSGSSELARAGMGDVLTGVAGAFLARGASPLEAAGLGLHFTGRAAMRSGEGEALLPTSVVEGLPGAMGEEGDGTTDLRLPFLLLDLPAAR